MCRPVGRGGSRGFARTPLFDLQKILYALLNCTFEIGSLASMLLTNHRHQNKPGCSYASLFMEDQREHVRKLFYAAMMKGHAQMNRYFRYSRVHQLCY